MKTPLDTKPEPDREYIKYYDAYKTLSFSKNMNGMIPFSELTNYIQFYGIKNSEKFIMILQALDAACCEAGRKKLG